MRYFIFSCIIFFSCGKEPTPPFIDFIITTTDSERFESIEIVTDFVRFFETIGDQRGVSNIQEYELDTIHHQLNKSASTLYNSAAHWALDLIGATPSIFNVKVKPIGKDAYREVKVGYVDALPIDEGKAFENEKNYTMEFTFQVDQAIEEVNGNLQLNWDYVFLTLKEK